ncbi:MAG: SGNH/GDSL hydrolase family protein [Cyanobacteria bacterium J06621_11]
MSDNPIRIEAEDMLLSGYRTERFDSLTFASGKAYTSLFAEGSNEQGTASTQFSGPTGTYDIVIAYFDEDDGVSAFNVTQNNSQLQGPIQLDSWNADSTVGGALPSAQSLIRRTISAVSLTSGDSIAITGIEDAGEAARVDYIEFVPASTTGDSTSDRTPPDSTNDTNTTTDTTDDTENTDTTNDTDDSDTTGQTGSNTGNTATPDQIIRVEAEDMTLDGYRTEDSSSLTFASNNAYTSLFAVRKNETGSATTQFSGATGTYDIVVAYFDEKDGISLFNLKKGEEELDSWEADGTAGTALPSAKSLVRRTISGISLENGESLTITGTENRGEAARVDYIEFIPSTPSTEDSEGNNDSTTDTDGGDGSTTDGSSGEDTSTDGTNGDNGSTGSTDGNVDGETGSGINDGNTIIRVEAENMSLEGYRTENFSGLTFASNGAYTSLFAQGDNETGTATTEFEGPTGNYDIVVAYFDEDDGVSSFTLTQSNTTLGNVTLDDWQAANTAGGTLPSAQSLVRRTISDVSLKNGDTLVLTGTENAGEAARVDYIEFIPRSNTPDTPTNNGPLSGSNGILEIMPLGDSITRGEDAQTNESLQNGYRDNLAQKLTNANIAFDFVGSLNNGDSSFDTDHEGHGGRRIEQIANNVNTWLENAKPEIILLKIGTNNMGFSTELVSTAIDKLSDLIDTIVTKRPAAKLIVSSIAPVNPSNFSAPAIVPNFQQRVADFNSQLPGLINNKITQGKQVSFADVYGALNTNQDLSSDGFHPTESGYIKIADVFFDAIADVLNTPDEDTTDENTTTDEDTTGGDTTGGDNTDTTDSSSGDSNSDGTTGNDTPDITEATGFTSRDGNNLYGSRKIDIITGTAANEVFDGGQKSDTLTGGGGSDIFHYSRPKEGLDEITDFGSDDFIRVSASKFTGGLQVDGALSTSESKTGVLVSSDEPISLGTKGNFLFDTTTQILSYDRDGIRTRHSPIEIAKLTGLASLSADQFIITN